MKIDHQLPEAEKTVISERLDGDEILYTVPCDLSADGKFVSAWSVVSHKKYLLIEGQTILRDIELAPGQEFKSVGLFGNGRLEMRVNDIDHFVSRYTNNLAAEYATIARALNQLTEGQIPKYQSIDEATVCPTCGRPYSHGSKVCGKCASKMKILSRLLAYAKPYWLLLGAVLLFYVAVTGLNLLIPRISRAIIDVIVLPKNPNFSLLIGYVLLNAAAVAGTIGFRILRGRTLAKLGNAIEKDLRQMVFTKIQALSLGYVNKQKTGNLMNRISEDTSHIQQFITGFTSELLNSLIFIIAAVFIILLRDWRLAALIALPAPLVFIIMKFVIGNLRRIERRVWRGLDHASNLLQDIISGIRVVKAFGKEEWEVTRFKKASAKVRDLTEMVGKKWMTLIPFFGFIFGFGQFLVLFYGGHLVLGQRMQIGELIQFSMYAGMIYGPLAWLTRLPREFTRMLISAARIFEVVDEEPEVKDISHPVRHTIKGRVVFDDITFGYRTHEPVIDGISLEIEEGEMIGLVGHSGAGKSTLINLLLRLYDVDEGRILIDGVNIRDISLQDLRSQSGVVLQETFLFSGTIFDNIRYAKPEATLQEIIQAAKIAHAHDFIVHFPSGYETQVGEKGQRLSGGESQRIAIARAIIHNPRILILDEATASVDTDTEQKIQNALDQLVKNRTTIAIAHRLATLRNADRLVVIEKGKKAEVGTHDDLMKQKGIYYNLVMTQRRMAGAIGVTG